MNIGPKSIRGRTVLVTVILSAIAMALITATVAFGMFSAMRTSMLSSLEDQLDTAESLVREGDFEQATHASGAVFVAVMDADGNIVASNSEAAKKLDLRRLLEGHEDDFDIDDDDLEQYEIDDDDDDEDDADDAAEAAASSGASGGGGSGSSGGSGGGSSSGSSSGSSTPAPAPAPAPTPAPTPAPAPAPVEVDDDDDDDYVEPTYTDDDDDDYDDGDDDSDDDDDDDDDDRDGSFIIPLPIRSRLPLAGGLRARFAATVSGEQLSQQADEQLSESTLTQIFGKRGPFLITQRKAVSGSESYTIIAATSIADVMESVRAATLRLAIIFVLLLGAIAWFTWFMSGKTLEPVEEMRAATESIIESDLASRIPVPAHDRDLAPLAATFNDVISRMEDDLAAQQRFISDASHELKSPVAASAIILETLANNPDAVRSDQVVADLLRENTRMQSIVSDLLTLARYDEGTTALDKSPTDIIDVVFEQVAALSARSAKSFDTSRVEPVIARVDERLVRHALSNLLENAERFAASQVRVSCAEVGDMLRIVVSDDGPGIPPQDRERVFDRFVRLNQTSEQGAKSSTGLGLAVVRSVAEAHGGRAFFAEPEMGGATAVLELPL